MGRGWPLDIVPLAERSSSAVSSAGNDFRPPLCPITVSPNKTIVAYQQMICRHGAAAEEVLPYPARISFLLLEVCILTLGKDNGYAFCALSMNRYFTPALLQKRLLSFLLFRAPSATACFLYGVALTQLALRPHCLDQTLSLQIPASTGSAGWDLPQNSGQPLLRYNPPRQ